MMESIQPFLDWGYQLYMVWSPPVHEMSLYLYNVLFFPMLFFSVLFYVFAFSGLMSRPGVPKPSRARNWPRVTVHIPTLNEIVAIRCAKKCLQFDYPKSKLDIIIGDDSDMPEVTSKLREFARKHRRVRLMKRKSNDGFKAGNLNNMLRHSRGDIIVSFDSDFMPPSNFLKKVVPPFLENDKVAFVQTKWKYINKNQNLVSRFASSVLMVYQNLLAMINSRLNVPLLFGSGLAVRKDVLTELGGWKEGSVTEDVEFSIRAISRGYSSVYVSDLAVPGEVPFTFKGFFKQQKRWAYGNAKTFMDHKRWILFGKEINFLQRISITSTLLGYVASPFLVAFMFFGTLSFMTGDPATIDIAKFMGTTSLNLAINSGFMAATLAALFRENETKMFFRVVLGSLTVGLYTAFGVTSGFLRAVTGREINWYMIRKAGNETAGVIARPSAAS